MTKEDDEKVIPLNEQKRLFSEGIDIHGSGEDRPATLTIIDTPEKATELGKRIAGVLKDERFAGLDTPKIVDFNESAGALILEDLLKTSENEKVYVSDAAKVAKLHSHLVGVVSDTNEAGSAFKRSQVIYDHAAIIVQMFNDWGA